MITSQACDYKNIKINFCNDAILQKFTYPKWVCSSAERTLFK